MIVGLLLLPLAYLAFLIARAIRGQRAGLIVSLALFALTIASGYWAIMQARSSTAGIGLVFLPMVAAVAGVLALGFGVLRHSERRASRMLATGLLVAAFGPSVLNVVDTRRTVSKNSRRDADQLVRDSAYQRYRGELAGMRAAATFHPDTINQLIRARGNDREFLLAALEHDGIAPELLDTLARSGDITIVRKAIEHRDARPATLARVYRTSSYPPYFYQTLASHASTPVEILREIYREPGPMSGLDIWFAGNASTPRDIVEQIARTSGDFDVIRVLLRHPSLDCALVNQIAAGPAFAKHPAGDDSVTRIRELRATLCR